jgi:predicted nucleic acid-binding protein
VATSPSTHVVFDASALIRAVIGFQPEARRWLERAVADELAPTPPAQLYVEVAQVLVRLTRAGRIEVRRALEALAAVRRLPMRVRSAHRLEEAMTLALERRVSVYDAAYVALAEALDAPLVTADRRLAEATPQAMLLPE